MSTETPYPTPKVKHMLYILTNWLLIMIIIIILKIIIMVGPFYTTK